MIYRYVILIRLHTGIYLCCYHCWGHTHKHSISSVPAPLQHPKPAMMGMIPEEEKEQEEEQEEEEESPSPAKKIRKLQNDDEEVCQDIL